MSKTWTSSHAPRQPSFSGEALLPVSLAAEFFFLPTFSSRPLFHSLEEGEPQIVSRKNSHFQTIQRPLPRRRHDPTRSDAIQDKSRNPEQDARPFRGFSDRKQFVSQGFTLCQPSISLREMSGNCSCPTSYYSSSWKLLLLYEL